MQKQPLVLRPRHDMRTGSFINNHSLVSQIITACGSPTSVLFPQAIDTNVRSFRSVLDTFKLKHAIYFAHKANQSDSLLKQLSATGVNCDVASIGELRHALACGFSGTRLQATGPKNAEFLHLCLLHNVAINVDCVQELKDILAVQKSVGSGQKARILLRLSNFTLGNNFELPPVKLSRFGIQFAQLANVLSTFIVPNRDCLDLLGFSFHLDSTSVEERLDAIRYCFDAFDQALKLNLTPRVINIGGGFGINYLTHEEDWTRYQAAIKEAALTSQTGMPSAITWNNNFFGLHAEGGTLRGSFNAYNFYNRLPGSAFLKELLSSKLHPYDKVPLGDTLRNNQIELWLEPGRALLDSAGLTLARVNSVKGPHDSIVGLDMKRQDLAFLDQEIFVDPILLRTLSTPDGPYKGYFLAGNLCLESDLIFRRKVFLPLAPEKGDIFAFINTAAYMMDFSATNSIMQPTARRVAVIIDKGSPTWMLDEQYSPVWHLH
jgi:diaminopimelate decarboxylase